MGEHGEEEERLGFTYDVFISFRGEDTRYTFIVHLRRELGRMGIKSFNDDRNMRIGESLSPALRKAIEESKIFIVVFSENYASSTWCLDELVRIIERSKMKEKKQLVFPVFYHVDPSDIRHERNSFGEHMKAHENENGKKSQEMKAWRSALSQAVDFPGRHITTGDDESQCIEEIVGKVREYITFKSLYSGQNPVGLDACIEEVMSLLEMKPYDKTVNMLGIYGLRGIGKTELAKTLYNKIRQHFHAASFLSDVREKSNRINGIKDLQKTLLSEMFEELETELGSTSKGMTEIEEKLQKKKVLLVLDDVGDKDQLEKLAGGCKWFGPGSRIIITTREKDVLIAHQVKNMYEMKELDDQHSLELFCWNAFRQSYPKAGFQNVSKRAVNYAKGLPLALKVIGSDLATLHKESLEDWEMAMEEYKKTPNKNIQDVLKISYDRLDDNAKQIFLFISFRGEDTRYTFIGHLRRELGRKGIKSFNDDNMRIGESLPPALSKAIEESKIFIVVFSENYASSTRCLDELVTIMKRSEKQLVYPVFYHVDPSDIRHERNSFGKHMKTHENEIGKESQRMQAWRSALSQAVDFPGRHITTGDDESYCIEEIVENVQEYITPKPLYSGQNPVGHETCIEEVMSLLDMKADDKTVRMLGIYGLGGIGKTELAKALYDKIVQHFDAASFLSDVREKSNRINGIEDLQKTLLFEMLEELEIGLGSTSKGMREIKEKLQKKKVLLVLDDVGDKDQLKKLAGGCNWFGPGSRIIITTREEDVLIAHQVKPKYEMKELDDQHSLQLFCWNAFRQSYPKTGFEDVSVRAVDYAKGLPLALKVIGSDLATFHESLEDWEMAMKEYEKTPNKKIQDVLKISYDRLDDNAKQIFLDIACFFKGERMEYVKKILQEFCPTTNIKVLLNKSLITIEYDCLKMHDLIQDMGREIVKQESPNPAKRSRIWYYEDAIEILTEDYGSDKIQGIMLDPPQQEKVEWSGAALVKMECLRILIVRNTSFSSELEHLPNYLRLLDWEEYPSKSFPAKFNPKHMIVLNLPRSSLTLEEPFKKFSKLRESFRSLVQHPSKADVRPKLQSLNVENGNLSDEDLLVILCYFPNLKELIASENNFVSIPSCIKECGDLTSLELNGCKKLKKIPEFTNLTILDVHHCFELEEISELPSSVQKVDARFCFKLTRETSDMLWNQVKKEGVSRIEVVMPFTTEIPEWFNYVGVQRYPRFWVRKKFPNIALAMILHFQDESERDKFARRRLVDLRLLINGRYVPCKGCRKFRIEAEHILIFDLRVLFSDKEWLVLDALLDEEWNLVQIAYNATSSFVTSRWGAFVYEDKTKMDDLLFTSPDPVYSDEM